MCSASMSNQSGLVLQATIIFTINQIWYSRNQFKHANLRPNRRISITRILVQTMFAGNNTRNLSYISIADFVLLKVFDIKICPPRAPNIIEVLWSPSNQGWFKCNYDGVYCPTTKVSGCGCIFRNDNGDFQLAYVEKLLSGSLIYAKLSIVLKTINIATCHGWHKL